MKKLWEKLTGKRFRRNPWDFWGVTPGEFWNDDLWWNGYYNDLLNNPDRSTSKETLIHRRITYLTQTLYKLEELPSTKNRTFLDVGCGISLLPHILKHWGFQVTAIDFCKDAIEFTSHHVATDENMAKCMDIYESQENHLVDAQKLHELQKNKTCGGALEFKCCNLNDPSLPENYFDIIYCKNIFRLSLKTYWNESLNSLYRLLKPGGFLFIETLNAIAIRHEVADLVYKANFVAWEPQDSLYYHEDFDECMPMKEFKPTEKYCYCLWPTG